MVVELDLKKVAPLVAVKDVLMVVVTVALLAVN